MTDSEKFREQRVHIGVPREGFSMDPIVVFDKLAQFKTSKELAAYLVSENCLGFMQMEDQCPIAEFFHKHLQHRSISVGTFVSAEVDWDVGPMSEYQTMWQKACTGAMIEFIEQFDSGYYPELLACNGEDFCICEQCISGDMTAMERYDAGEEGE